jgi:IS30 family transposase
MFILPNVRQKLKINWSTEIIAGRLKEDMSGQSISPEAIYQFIYHRDTPDREQLISQLCRAHRKRRIKGKGRKVRKTKITIGFPSMPGRSRSIIASNLVTGKAIR